MSKTLDHLNSYLYLLYTTKKLSDVYLANLRLTFILF
jgi:hypothetical protein